MPHLRQTDRDLLERLDAHLARGNEEFRLNREFQAKAVQDWRAFHAQALEDWREFTRTTILRVGRMGRDQMRELSRMNDGLARELSRNSGELSRQGREQRELREESRAQTQALLRMIDRFDRLEPPPAAS